MKKRERICSNHTAAVENSTSFLCTMYEISRKIGMNSMMNMKFLKAKDI